MFILEFIGDVGYFTISFYFTCTIAAIVIPILLVRLLRAFPFYVKHGDLGCGEHSIWLGDDKRPTKQVIHDFFTETHPSAIGSDLVAIGLLTILLHMVWGLVPFIILGRLIWLGVAGLANHMRSQHIKKQAFHAALKGD